MGGGGGGGIGGVGGGGDGNCDAETTKAALNNVAIFFKNSFFGNLRQNSARMIWYHLMISMVFCDHDPALKNPMFAK